MTRDIFGGQSQSSTLSALIKFALELADASELERPPLSNHVARLCKIHQQNQHGAGGSKYCIVEFVFTN